MKYKYYININNKYYNNIINKYYIYKNLFNNHIK